MQIGFTGVLTLILVVLKAFKIISRPWLWCFAPVLIGIAVGLGILLVTAIM